jgi:hypothetical protein
VRVCGRHAGIGRQFAHARGGSVAVGQPTAVPDCRLASGLGELGTGRSAEIVVRAGHQSSRNSTMSSSLSVARSLVVRARCQSTKFEAFTTVSVGYGSPAASSQEPNSPGVRRRTSGNRGPRAFPSGELRTLGAATLPTRAACWRRHPNLPPPRRPSTMPSRQLLHHLLD